MDVEGNSAMSPSLSDADSELLKSELARRIRKVRHDRFGEHGGPLMADALRLPVRTWLSYEGGGAIPGTVLLHFIDLTGVHPHWLLTGEGAVYLGSPEPAPDPS
jgi:hypothetical protein